MTDRLTAIRDRITLTFTVEMPCIINSVPESSWSGVGATGPFGFQWPFLLDETCVLPVCFEVMARTTEWMDDDVLDMYLDLIEFQISRHVVHLTSSEPGDLDARVHAVDAELWDLRPDAMTFLSDLQMQILDSQESP